MTPYPIDDILPRLKEAVCSHSAVVLHAPAGAGKTTRVPLALLDILPPGKGRILMLEPRRIAAVSAARWMARTLGEEAGGTVGYSIRFDTKTTERTRIEVVTEGILTRRIQTDPGLDGIAMVIFDEFHERSLHADLALALCIEVRGSLREDLKILVMSATLECGPVADLLGGAPVITSGGRAFPVEERYPGGRQERPLPERTTDAVKTALRETQGDVLVFLPGSGEIRSCSELLRPLVERGSREITLHPLYGDLPFEEQERALLPSKARKVVLATNIAETSLTIEGVRCVIDSGLTRRLQYDPTTGMNRLITVAVSRASAEQRKGRAGRLGPGVCYRLYSRHAFHSLIPYAPPEMLVSDLSSLVLDLAVWGVKDPSALSWLDAPPAASWEAALRLLADLGALDPAGSATPSGRMMVRMPLSPRLARLLLRAGELGSPRLGADLAALLSGRDVLRRTAAERGGVAEDPDIKERLSLLCARRRQREAPGGADHWALRTVERTAEQLLRLVPGSGKAIGGGADDPELVSRLLVSAFPERIARRREEGEGRFLLVQGRGVRVSPASAMSRSPFIIAAAMDAGEGAEGFVHIAAPLTGELIRRECAGRISVLRRVEWNKEEGRIIAALEERLGAVPLSVRPFSPSDAEAVPLLCEAIRANPGLLSFNREARQLQGRVALMRRTFPEEAWPDLSEGRLPGSPEEWLLPWLGGMRSSRDL
ncbi:MAG: ATP-dependent helicase HrpB, partial [Nitrospirales bacterium]|nr:ATP-dependent helicase HrpB [Nitrospirales bacterium]